MYSEHINLIVWLLLVNLKVNISAIAVQVKVMIGVDITLIDVLSMELTLR